MQPCRRLPKQEVNHLHGCKRTRPLCTFGLRSDNISGKIPNIRIERFRPTPR